LKSHGKREKFKKVLDEQKKRVRGLWERKGSYYAQFDASDGQQYKYPLHSATTVPQAITETQVLKKFPREGKLFSPAEMRLGGKKGQSAALHLLKAAIADYNIHRVELKAEDEATWSGDFAGYPFEGGRFLLLR
jgi:hypothetical protein